MEFEKFYFPLKRIEGDQHTNEIVGIIKIIKNGYKFSLKVFFNALNSAKYISIFAENQLIEKAEIANEIILNFKVKANAFSAIIYDSSEKKICYAGSPPLEKISNIFSDYENLDEVIDYYFNNSNKISKKDILKKALLSPLFLKKKLKYNKSIEQSLKTALANFPREVVLEDMFKNSRWVKAEIKNKIVVLGVIFFKNEPSKIGVGFPSKKTEEKIIKKCGSLKFYSIFKNSCYGYYLNFKDASSGKEID